MRLLLASQSPARQQMLQAAGVPFDTVDAGLDEAAAKAALERQGLDALGTAEALAELKALSAAAGEADLVLGSDQTLEREDGGMLSKPGSREEALEQLRSLAGRTHRLHSAAVIAEHGRPVWHEAESVALTVRPLSDAFLRQYLDREYQAIRWSVGGYRIEGLGVQLFDRIEGSHFAVLGLPLLPLLAFLRERGVLAS
ncbi:MAG TPA: Maf family protein [Allosphingosinicella sp.]|nr:Maf family protein [Allosphingosinicella sp.]